MTPLVRRRVGIAAALTTVSLVLAGCSSDEPTRDLSGSSDPSTTAESGDGAGDGQSIDPDAEAPEPAEPGPYAVGRRTEQVVDAEREDRTMAVEVWYPSSDPSSTTPYELIPGVSFASALSATGATPSTDGPFPVVVFSHGSGGLRQQSASIVETIASHGFVVVAPDHPGNTAIDLLLDTATPPRVTATNRVGDLGVVLDRIEDGELASGLVDTETIAVMGHSFGGFTALAGAGGYDDVPGDPRIDAVVALAPFSEFLSDADLEAIDVPLLVVTGSDDTTTPVENQSTRPVNLAGDESELVVIDGAGHVSITDVCAIADAIENGGDAIPEGAADAVRAQAGDVCGDRGAISRAFDAAEHYSVGFLRSVLLDDERYDEVGPIRGATVRQ